MIFTERTITVVNDSATINKPLILYRGDKNIELKITIAESQFKFRNTDASNVIETTDASYAQLVINTPYNSPIFSDVAATKNGAVIFVITEAMIDEIREVGAYEIQIRLLDDNKQSRASIPPVSNAIEIREPIAIEDGSAVDSNVVNVAKVNRALTTTSAPLEAFDSQGNYIKKTWGDGDPITDAALNKMEAGIDGVNKKITNVNNINDTTASATTTYSSNKIETIKGNISSQIRDIENYSLVKHTDGLLYIKKQDGTLIGTGVEVGSGADLSKVTMSMDGQTLKLLNDGTQIATVEIPTAVVTDEQLTTIIQSKIDDGTLSSLTIEDGSITYSKLADDAKFAIGKRINLINPDAYTGKHLNVADKTELIEVDANKVYTCSSSIAGSGTWASYAYDTNRAKLGQLGNYATLTTINGGTKIEITNSEVKYLELYLYPSTTTAMLVEGDVLPLSFVSYDTMSYTKNDNLVNPLRNVIFENEKIKMNEMNGELIASLNKLGYANERLKVDNIKIYSLGGEPIDNSNASIQFNNNSIISPASVKEYLFIDTNISDITYIPGDRAYYLLLSKIDSDSGFSGKMLEMTTTSIRALRRYDYQGTISSEEIKDIYITENTITKINVSKTKNNITLLINDTDKVALSYSDLGFSYQDVCIGFSRVIGLPSHTIASDIFYSYQGVLDEKITLMNNDDMSNLKWNAIGDSMTYPIDAYHYWINKQTGINVNNYGVSGNTTGDILNRIGGFQTDVDIVTVFAGTNDFGKDIAIDTTKANVESILQNLITNNLGKKIAWILPIQRADKSINTLELTLLDYVDAIKEVCVKYSVPTLDLYREGNFPACVSAFATKYMSTDKLHPNTNGQMLLSNKILTFLKNI